MRHRECFGVFGCSIPVFQSPSNADCHHDPPQNVTCFVTPVLRLFEASTVPCKIDWSSDLRGRPEPHLWSVLAGGCRAAKKSRAMVVLIFPHGHVIWLPDLVGSSLQLLYVPMGKNLMANWRSSNANSGTVKHVFVHDMYWLRPSVSCLMCDLAQ